MKVEGSEQRKLTILVTEAVGRHRPSGWDHHRKMGESWFSSSENKKFSWQVRSKTPEMKYKEPHPEVTCGVAADYRMRS